MKVEIDPNAPPTGKLVNLEQERLMRELVERVHEAAVEAATLRARYKAAKRILARLSVLEPEAFERHWQSIRDDARALLEDEAKDPVG